MCNLHLAVTQSVLLQVLLIGINLISWKSRLAAARALDLLQLTVREETSARRTLKCQNNGAVPLKIELNTMFRFGSANFIF